MHKLILSTLFLSFLLFAPVTATAEEVYEPIAELSPRDISISVQDRTVVVEGAEGKTLGVYDLAGNRILTVEIDTDSKRITLNVPRGLYIVRIGDVARKVQVR